MVTDLKNFINNDLTKQLHEKVPQIQYKYIHWAIFREIIKESGYILEQSGSNGWEHDVWFHMYIPGTDYYYEIMCSWYYPETTFTLIDDDPKTVKRLKNEI